MLFSACAHAGVDPAQTCDTQVKFVVLRTVYTDTYV